MASELRVLMLGDVVGDSGIEAIASCLPGLIADTEPDLVVANGENARSGFGLSADNAASLFAAGVQVISSGNHIWESPGMPALIAAGSRILRPANYPAVAPGEGFLLLETSGRAGSALWCIINLQGREGMPIIDCPFVRASQILAQLRFEHPEAIAIVDFHAESPEEKEALAWHLDASISVLAGTHTHVQTADERILPGGCGYITDLGMTGPEDSVIGMDADTCIQRFRTQIPLKMQTARGPGRIHGALFRIDAESRRCLSIQRI